jgi:hypothetical protein
MGHVTVFGDEADKVEELGKGMDF